MKTFLTVITTIMVTLMINDIYHGALGFGPYLQGWVSVILHGFSYVAVVFVTLFVHRREY